MPVLHKKETMLDMTSSVCVKLAVLGGEKVGKSGEYLLLCTLTP